MKNLLNIALVLLLIVSCNDKKDDENKNIALIKDSASNSQIKQGPTSPSKTVANKNSFSTDYARIALAEWFNSDSKNGENYDFNNPIIKEGKSVYCDAKKINFVLVCFQDKTGTGYSFVFLEYNKDGYFSSIISRGETVETPDQMFKAALEADEKTNDYWYCGSADE